MNNEYNYQNFTFKKITWIIQVRRKLHTSSITKFIIYISIHTHINMQSEPEIQSLTV